jgi:hypothetical protein
VISREKKVAMTVGTCNRGKMAVSGGEADGTFSPCLTHSSIYRWCRDSIGGAVIQLRLLKIKAIVFKLSSS